MQAHVTHVDGPARCESLHFPEEAEVPETTFHLLSRTLLYQLLRDHLGDQHSVGSEQFVYFEPQDPKKCLAPDVFVALNVPFRVFPIWKTWEHGVVQLAVEIISPSNVGDWQGKLEAYQHLGVEELVAFDPDAPLGTRLRVWDRVDGVLRERTLVAEQTPCRILKLEWVLRPGEGLACVLRLAHDHPGQRLLPTRHEAGVEDRQARVAAEQQRNAETALRTAAERRIEELEEALRRRG